MLQRDINTGLLLRDTAGVCSGCCAGECTVCSDASKYTPAYIALTLTGAQTQNSCSSGGYGWTFSGVSLINGIYYIPHCVDCRYIGIVEGDFGTGTHYKPPSCTTFDYTQTYNRLIIYIDIAYPFGWSMFLYPAAWDGTYLVGGPGLSHTRSVEEDPCIFETESNSAYGYHFLDFGTVTLDTVCDGWSSGVLYEIGEIVCVDGYTGYYVCTVQNIGHSPPSYTSEWTHKTDEIMQDITGYPGYESCGF